MLHVRLTTRMSEGAPVCNPSQMRHVGSTKQTQKSVTNYSKGVCYSSKTVHSSFSILQYKLHHGVCHYETLNMQSKVATPQTNVVLACHCI